MSVSPLLPGPLSCSPGAAVSPASTASGVTPRTRFEATLTAGPTDSRRLSPPRPAGPSTRGANGSSCTPVARGRRGRSAPSCSSPSTAGRGAGSSRPTSLTGSGPCAVPPPNRVSRRDPRRRPPSPSTPTTLAPMEAHAQTRTGEGALAHGTGDPAHLTAADPADVLRRTVAGEAPEPQLVGLSSDVSHFPTLLRECLVGLRAVVEAASARGRRRSLSSGASSTSTNALWRRSSLSSSGPGPTRRGAARRAGGRDGAAGRADRRGPPGDERRLRPLLEPCGDGLRAGRRWGPRRRSPTAGVAGAGSRLGTARRLRRAWPNSLVLPRPSLHEGVRLPTANPSQR